MRHLLGQFRRLVRTLARAERVAVAAQRSAARTETLVEGYRAAGKILRP